MVAATSGSTGTRTTRFSPSIRATPMSDRLSGAKLHFHPGSSDSLGVSWTMFEPSASATIRPDPPRVPSIDRMKASFEPSGENIGAWSSSGPTTSGRRSPPGRSAMTMSPSMASATTPFPARPNGSGSRRCWAPMYTATTAASRTAIRIRMASCREATGTVGIARAAISTASHLPG